MTWVHSVWDGQDIDMFLLGRSEQIVFWAGTSIWEFVFSLVFRLEHLYTIRLKIFPFMNIKNSDQFIWCFSWNWLIYWLLNASAVFLWSVVVHRCWKLILVAFRFPRLENIYRTSCCIWLLKALSNFLWHVIVHNCWKRILAAFGFSPFQNFYGFTGRVAFLG